MRRYGRELQFLLGLPSFLRRPISFQEARNTILRRLSAREQQFITFFHRAIFTNPSSPYLPLLRAAGLTPGDVPREVKRQGVEGFLKALKDAGVWVASEEYKGHRPLVRGNFIKQFQPRDFDYPIPLGRFEITSGGSTGKPAVSHMYWDSLAARACYEHLVFRMLNLYQVPLALWYPKLPAATGLGNSLRYGKIGHPPTHWFQLLNNREVRPSLKSRLENSVFLWLSRLTPAPIPWPEPLDFNRPETILSWIEEMVATHGRCVLQSYVSQVVRICVAAAERGRNLKQTLFIVGAEPLTPAKYRQIKAVQASVYSRYYSSEMGSIALGCGHPAEVGELHLLSDTVALIPGEPGESGEEARPFYLTSFTNTVPKVLVNAQIGDTGLVTQRRCGCLLDELGFHTHLTQVRNYSLTSVEGMSMRAGMLRHLSEEVLPARFGGSPLDYQWLEAEERSAFTRLILRVHPRLGQLDEKTIIQVVLQEMRRQDEGHRLMATLWSEAGSLGIERSPPQLTALGKLPIILRREAKP